MNNQNGGDGYSINVSEAIGGMPGHMRYSDNYRPVFLGDLLQDGGKKSCGCSKNENSKNKNIYNMIKEQYGGNQNKISQVDAIREIAYNLSPLHTSSLKALVSKLFFKNLSDKDQSKYEQYGGFTTDFKSIIAPLGKNNLLVLASLLLLHYFAVERKEEETNKRKKVMKGGYSFLSNISKILAPTGMNQFGSVVLLVLLKEAFSYDTNDNTEKKIMKKGKIQKGGNVLKNIIAPLGTNAFIATGLLIILEKIFIDKMNEPKGKTMKGGKLNEQLFNLLAPITFNVFANENMLNEMSYKLKNKSGK